MSLHLRGHQVNRSTKETADTAFHECMEQVFGALTKEIGSRKKADRLFPRRTHASKGETESNS